MKRYASGLPSERYVLFNQFMQYDTSTSDGCTGSFVQQRAALVVGGHRKPLSCLFTFGNKNKNLYLPTA